MTVILFSLLLVGLAVFLLSFNVIFRKNGKFPETEIGGNKELRKKGLMCAKSEERILWSKKNRGSMKVKYDPISSGCSSCSTCGSGCE
jgi:hypothetical protein